MSGNVKLGLPSGGSLTISGADSASNLTVTIPAASDTVDLINTAQTLTNKTITAAGSNTVEATSGPTSSQLAGNRNKIINGAMMIDQRNAGAAITTGGYSVDRFQVINGTDGTFSAQQSTTTATGFINSLLWTTTAPDTSLAATQYAAIFHKIEGSNVSDLAWGSASAATITLSFFVRSSLTGTFGGALSNSAGDRSYPFTYTISSANTFEYKTVTIPGDTTGTWLTTNGIGILVSFGLGTGTSRSGTAGSWMAGIAYSATGATSVVGTNGATFYITGVQLEKGATATPFENRLYGTELALCQRYYQQGFTWFGKFSAATSYYGYGTYQVEMRTAPTVTYISGGSISEIGVADRSVTAIPSYSGNNKGGYFQATVSGATTGNAGANAAGAPTVAGFSAEL